MSRGGWLLVALAVTVVAWFTFGHHLVHTNAKPPARPNTTYAPVPHDAPLHGIAWQITHVYNVVAKAEKVIPNILALPTMVEPPDGYIEAFAQAIEKVEKHHGDLL